MYARVISCKSGAGQAGKMAEFYREVAVPSMQADAGFKGAYLLADPTGDKFVAISLWASEADLQASEAGNRARQARGKEAGMIVEVLGEERLEVVVQV